MDQEKTNLEKLKDTITSPLVIGLAISNVSN